LALLAALGVAVTAVLAWHYNRLLLDSVSPPLARVAGVPSARLQDLFVVLLTIAIVVSLKIVGALLVEALVIVPAAAGRNLGRTRRGYVAWSILAATAAGFGGLALSTVFFVPTGGAVVLALSAIFFVTLAAGAVTERLGRAAARQ